MGKCDVLNKLISENIHPSIIEYISEALINFSGNKIELAIAIYIKLAELFWYSPKFAVDNDYDIIDSLFEITLENNDVICLHWGVIYSKLLDMYGIENELCGTDAHVMVKIMFDDFIIYTDVTKNGFEKGTYQLADLTNLKLNLKISGMYTLSSKKNEELDRIIDKVYFKLGMKYSSTEKIDRLFHRFRTYADKRIKRNKEQGFIVDANEIYARIRFINHFYNLNINMHKVERLQIFSKYYREVFDDFPFEQCRSILLKEEAIEPKILRMLVISEDCGIIHFFLEEENGFIEYSKKELLEIFKKRDIGFKNEFYEVLGFNEIEVGVYSKVKSRFNIKL